MGGEGRLGEMEEGLGKGHGAWECRRYELGRGIVGRRRRMEEREVEWERLRHFLRDVRTFVIGGDGASWVV